MAEVTSGKVSAERTEATKRQFFPGVLLRRLLKEQPLGIFGGVVVLLLVLVTDVTQRDIRLN